MRAHRKLSGLALTTLAVLAGAPALHASDDRNQDQKWNHPLPFGAHWALQRGIDLPNPFGVSLFVVSMSRDIEVYDVRVTVPGKEPVSVSNVASFDVRNRATLGALKLDAWILPLLDVLVLAGHTWTDTRLNAAVTIDRILGPPVVIDVTQDSHVGGPLFGVGATAVAGYGPWFIMADANYNYSGIEEFESGIWAWFLSARTGRSGVTGWGSWRAWTGAAYLSADRTLTMTEESPILGTVKVEVDQRPVNPMTLQVGGSLALDRRWELMVELGSNFDDAFLTILSASFRF